MTMAPTRECERLVWELGRMRPSATAMNSLLITVESAWDVNQDGALEAIRAEEALPAEATMFVVSLDGVPVGMPEENETPGEKRRHGGRATGKYQLARFFCTARTATSCAPRVPGQCRNPARLR